MFGTDLEPQPSDGPDYSADHAVPGVSRHYGCGDVADDLTPEMAAYRDTMTDDLRALLGDS